MNLKKILTKRGVKLRTVSNLLNLKEGALTHRFERNTAFSFTELAILRKNKIIDLQDLDNLTREIDIKK